MTFQSGGSDHAEEHSQHSTFKKKSDISARSRFTNKLDEMSISQYSGSSYLTAIDLDVDYLEEALQMARLIFDSYIRKGAEFEVMLPNHVRQSLYEKFGVHSG